MYAIDTLPTLKDSIATSDDVSQYSHLNKIPLPDLSTDTVQLLIGQDNPGALIKLESRHGEPDEPYAVRTSLGWTINGLLHKPSDRSGCYNTLRCELPSEKTSQS